MSFVKVFYCDISQFFDEDKLLSRINEVDGKRAERIKRAVRAETKAQLLGAGLIVPLALQKAFGRSDFTIETDALGKPQVTNAEGVHFNLSHTGKFAVCAVSDVPVGVDVEEIASSAGMIGIANKFFTVFERSAIALSPSPEEAFCRLWTLRESYVKMLGTGFDRGLAPLACEFPDGVPKIKDNGKLCEDVFFTEIRDIYLCRGAVCTRGEAEYSIEKLTL